MKLSEYLKQDGGAGNLARELGVATSYMINMAAGVNPISPARAVVIARATGGLVPRWETRPKDWHLIWPELVGTEGAPAVPAEKQAA